MFAGVLDFRELREGQRSGNFTRDTELRKEEEQESVDYTRRIFIETIITTAKTTIV